MAAHRFVNASLAAAMMVVPLGRAAIPLPEPLETHPCRATFERQLTAWEARDETFRAPSGPLGGDVYRIATRHIGRWVTVHVEASSAMVSLFLTDSKVTTRLEYDAECSPTRVSIRAPIETSARPRFTDDDLRVLLADERPVVVYVWSPHLPLSADGYREIEAATGGGDSQLVTVVDPSAEDDYTEAIAEKVGIPDSARRRLSSIELLFRDLTVHAPAIIIFANGDVSAPLPGYRDRAAYRRHIESFVASTR